MTSNQTAVGKALFGPLPDDVAGHGRPAKISGGVRMIRSQVEESASDYDKQRLRGRLAQLVGVVAVRGIRS